MSTTLQKGSTYSATVEATVTEDVDVVVAGGGTAGVVAAIAAARTGADVLLIERRGFLGGMMTGGNAGLTKYTVYEKRQSEHRKIVAELATDPASVHIAGGIPMEITKRLIEERAAVGTAGTAGSYVFTSAEEFKLLLLTMMEEAGVKLLLHSLVVDVIKDGRTVRGLVVESKSGREALLARIVIDATGDGDAAARAGASFVVGVEPDGPCARHGVAPGSVMHMGVMFRAGNVDLKRLFEHLKQHREPFCRHSISHQSIEEAHEAFVKGEMSCFGLQCPTHWCQVYNSPLPGVVTLCCPLYEGSGLDVEDLSRGEIELAREVHKRVNEMKQAVPGFEDAFLLDMPEIGVRETRHIQGEHVLDIEEVLSQCEFPDSIGRGAHPIDIGAVPDDLKNRPMSRWYFNMPYRCLVVKDLDNMLVAGRCISVTHEALGCTRGTVQCMITGQAAGTAAALCVQEGLKPRDLDGGRLRKKLVDDGVVV